MGENQKRLTFRRKRPAARRTGARERDFCRYMSLFGAIFPSGAGLRRAIPRGGLEFPWGASAIPPLGFRNASLAPAPRPHGSAQTAPEGGRPRAAALTVCHMAHKAPACGRRGAAARRGRGRTVLDKQACQTKSFTLIKIKIGGVIFPIHIFRRNPLFLRQRLRAALGRNERLPSIYANWIIFCYGPFLS